MIGATVGNYRILEKLGEGGMGAVFRGVDLTLEREVAIKMLRTDLSEQPGLIDRFRAEAITLARLHHPNIAILFNFFRHNNNFFMALEYVRGRTLGAVIKERGAMPCGEAVALVEQALDGLAHAHHLNIIHRDLKPANLMLTDTGVIKITDFGIARVLGTSRMTRPGGVVGTLEYMSPERVRGLEADARSDLYSVGIVLYELLTGHAPFHNDSDYELMRAQIEAPPLPPHMLAPDLPDDVERVILRALAKAPEARYQTAREMRDALRAAAQTPPQPRSRELFPARPLFDTKTGERLPIGRETVPLIFPTAARPTELVTPIKEAPAVTSAERAKSEDRGRTPIEEAAAVTLVAAPLTELDLPPANVAEPPEVKPKAGLAAEPSLPPGEAELPPSAVEASTPPLATAVAKESAESDNKLFAAFTPGAPAPATLMSRLTWKHYAVAGIGLVILLFALFALLRPRPAPKQVVAPTPDPSVAAETVASPSPLPTDSPAGQTESAAASPSPEKAAAGKGAAKPRPGQSAEAREKERQLREIQKALRQKGNQ